MFSSPENLVFGGQNPLFFHDFFGCPMGSSKCLGEKRKTRSMGSPLKGFLSPHALDVLLLEKTCSLYFEGQAWRPLVFGVVDFPTLKEAEPRSL